MPTANHVREVDPATKSFVRAAREQAAHLRGTACNGTNCIPLGFMALPPEERTQIIRDLRGEREDLAAVLDEVIACDKAIKLADRAR